MPNTKPLLVRTSEKSQRTYPRPVGKQVALFCYLTRIMWKLACRIRWARLCEADLLRLSEVQPMLSRTEAKSRLAHAGEPRNGQR